MYVTHERTCCELSRLIKAKAGNSTRTLEETNLEVHHTCPYLEASNVEQVSLRASNGGARRDPPLASHGHAEFNSFYRLGRRAVNESKPIKSLGEVYSPIGKDAVGKTDRDTVTEVVSPSDYFFFLSFFFFFFSIQINANMSGRPSGWKRIHAARRARSRIIDSLNCIF